MSDSAPFIQANTNGRLHDAREASVSPLDRGFLYGDAVYEVWRTYHGTVFAFAEHWARLEASACALHFALPFDAATALRELARAVAAFRARTGEAGELYIRLQITRGGGRIGLDPALTDGAPVWVFLVQRVPALTDAQLRAGVTAFTAQALRRNHPATLNPAWKTGNYLNNLLALREARAAGADEVVLLNLDGAFTEASAMNLAFVRDGTVLTPPLAAGILSGITRGLLLREVAPRAGVLVRETPLRPADLAGCTEAFFLATTKDLVPIAGLDDRRFAVGPGTVTLRLKTAFADYARAYASAHPEYRVF